MSSIWKGNIAYEIFLKHDNTKLNFSIFEASCVYQVLVSISE